MKSVLFAAIVALSAGSASAFGISFSFGADGEDAIMCEVNEVAVLAASMEDCTTVGGTPTHTVESTATPIEN